MHEKHLPDLQRFSEEAGQDGTGSNSAASDAGMQESPLSFEELLKQNPQYKAAYDEKVRRAVEGRFRGMRDSEQKQKKQDGEQNRQRLAAFLESAREFERREPGFRLRQELRNPVFHGLVAEGTPLEAAYLLAHQEEALLRAMAYAIHHTTGRAAQSIRSGALRPREGAAGSKASAPTAPDPRALSGKDRKALREAVSRGKKIYW